MNTTTGQRKKNIMNTTTRPLKYFALMVVSACLVGCATTATELSAPSPDDPWESANRSVFAFNKRVDSAVLRPAAVAYDRITPDPAQRGVSNFFTNLKSPWVTSQLLLQGRFEDGSEQFGRFVVNTVFGVGGLFDVADQADFPEYDADLGSTLARWGWAESRFVMLPLLGPSTVRDGVGQVTEIVAEPVDQEFQRRTHSAVTAFDVIQTRAAFLTFDDRFDDAFDEYAMVRDSWLQRRQYELFGEASDLPDYDAFIEDSNDTPDPQGR